MASIFEIPKARYSVLIKIKQSLNSNTLISEILLQEYKHDFRTR